MAIFHVAEMSGPALSLRDRLRGLAERGSLDVVVPGEGPTADSYRQFAQVRFGDYRALVLPRGPAGLWRMAGELRRDVKAFRKLIRERRPDLVVVVTAMLPAAQIAARREGATVALAASELLTSGRAAPRRLVGRMLARAAARNADVVFANSRAVAAEYEAGPAPVHVAYPPIEDRFAGGDGLAFRKRHGIPGDVPLVLAVGAITERRGQTVLVEAARIVRERHPVVCAIVGEPFPRAPDIAFERRLCNQATGLGEGAVRMVGYEPNIADAYAAADVVVNPSTGPEAFGRVPCEALVAGCPVVATRTGATAEVLRDGKTALLVPPGDSSSMAKAIATLIDDPQLAKRLAKHGRDDVLHRFTADAAEERFSAGVASALEARRP